MPPPLETGPGDTGSGGKGSGVTGSKGPGAIVDRISGWAWARRQACQFAVMMDCKITKPCADLGNTNPRLTRRRRIGATAAVHTSRAGCSTATRGGSCRDVGI